MKKLIYVAAVGVLFAACGGESKKTAEETKEVKEASVEAVTYTVNTEESSVKWHGEKVLKGQHNGTVQLSSGSFSFNGEELEAGNFTIDMNTIVDEDLKNDTLRSDLINHLKSGDFFLVDSFPTAKFEITEVKAAAEGSGATHTITGNLTIKGKTNGITFPATISQAEGKVSANATFEINRNEWGIVWGGSEETNQGVLDFLKDNLLKDMIKFEVNLQASK